MNLEPQDYALIVAGALMSLAGGFSAQAGILSVDQVDILTGILPTLSIILIFVGVGFVYLSLNLWGGQVSRNLQVIASGFLVYGLLYWPHLEMWHASGEPAWIGISSGGWQTFFHLLTVTTLVIVSYGFYLFWDMVQRGGER